MDYVDHAGIRIAKPLYEFVNGEALPGTSIGADAFWSGFAGLLADLAPRCKTLLRRATAFSSRSMPGTSPTRASRRTPMPT